jgi:hypothetical protein
MKYRTWTWLVSLKEYQMAGESRHVRVYGTDIAHAVQRAVAKCRLGRWSEVERHDAHAWGNVTSKSGDDRMFVTEAVRGSFVGARAFVDMA